MEQKLEEIGERLENSPQKSLRRLAQQTDNLKASAWNICDSPGVSAGLACTHYCRPSRTVNSLLEMIQVVLTPVVFVISFYWLGFKIPLQTLV